MWLTKFFRRAPEYTHGTAGSDKRPARKHASGRVEFVMWKAGEEGHATDYWIAFHEYWWPTFEPDDKSTQTAARKR